MQRMLSLLSRFRALGPRLFAWDVAVTGSEDDCSPGTAIMSDELDWAPVQPPGAHA